MCARLHKIINEMMSGERERERRVCVVRECVPFLWHLRCLNDTRFLQLQIGVFVRPGHLTHLIFLLFFLLVGGLIVDGAFAPDVVEIRFVRIILFAQELPVLLNILQHLLQTGDQSFRLFYLFFIVEKFLLM